MKQPFIVALIPAYNEERTIAKIVLKTKKYVDKVIVCDDGSTDMTGEIARALGAEVIRHERNMGKGVALRTGLEYAKKLDPDIVVVLDADGQHNPDEIPKLIEPLLRGETDIVIGSRFLTPNEIPLYRRIGNRILTSLVNLKAGSRLTDTQSGFRAFNRRALEEIKVTEKGMSVESQMIIDAIKKGLRASEIPITVSYKEARHKRSPLLHFMEIVSLILRRTVEEKPILYLGLPGFMLILAGLIAGLRVLDIFMRTRAIAIGTALITAILTISGLLLIVIAILMHYIKVYLKERYA